MDPATFPQDMYYPTSYVRPRPDSSAASPAPVLALAGVHRLYGRRIALAPVDLAMQAGSVGVVRGANGAGKTTLLRIAAGLLEPSGGARSGPACSVYLAAGDGGRGAQSVEDAVGFAALSGGADASPVLSFCGLADEVATPVGALSAGRRSRLSLAVALAATPALLCLDEPTAHLDEEGVRLAMAVVSRLSAAGTAVLVATHDPAAFAMVADSILELRDGRLKATS